MRSAILVVLAALAACSNSQQSGSFRSTDASVSGDSGTSDANADADANTCVTEGGPGASCLESVESYCAHAETADAGYFSGCGSTWHALQADPPCQAADGLQIDLASCGSTETMSLDGIDFSTIYVYDTASGTLVAVVGYGDPGVFGCTAGPSCVAPPSCGSHQTVTCPVDAGTEAASDGAIGDAGGD